MWEALIFLIILAIGVWSIFRIKPDPCPRKIRGWECKGKECDHSRAALDEANWDVHRR